MADVPPILQNNQGCKGRDNTQIHRGPVQPYRQGVGAAGVFAATAAANAELLAVISL